jgi:hypothetical protein
MSLSELIDTITRTIEGRIHTGMPARVLSYDHATQTCTAQPIIKKQIGETFDALPALSRVPVAFPRGGGFVITHPLAKGDWVFLSFAERSIEEWRGGATASYKPKQLRKFDLSDAIAYPISSPGSPLTGHTEGALTIGSDDVAGVQIVITDVGKISIGTPAVDVITLLDTLLGAIDVFTTATSAAVVEPTLAAASLSLKATSAAVRASLSTIKR